MPTKQFVELPKELIAAILDYLSPQEIVQVSHLCAACRTIAEAHPTFWRDIRLSSTSGSAMDFFAARINSRTTPGLRIHIDLPSLEDVEGQASVILHAIDRNLYRMARLRLRLSAGIKKHVFAALSKQAPLLGDLALVFLISRAAVPLPSGIFSGHCPELRRLRLDGCALLPHDPICAFARVERLAFTPSLPEFVPVDLFTSFPVLQDLDLNAACGVGDLARFCRQFQGNDQLKSLTLRIPRIDTEALFARCPALLATPVVQLLYDAGPVRQLVSQLPGPLGIELGALRYTVRSHSHGWRRTFAIPRNRLKVWPSKAFYASDAVRLRVGTLALEARTYNDHVLGALPACVTLRIALGGADVRVRRPLELPGLQRVELCSGGSATPADVEAGALVRFLVSLVRERTPAVALHIDGLSVSGDAAVLVRAGFVLGGARAGIQQLNCSG